MAEEFRPKNGRSRVGDGEMDPSEVETFDPEHGPNQEPPSPPLPRRRTRTSWKDVANTKPMPEIDPDVYTTKKSVAQAFMDVALLSANADQLRTLLKTGDSDSPIFVMCMVFIVLSLVAQVVIAVLLLLKTRYNINNPDQFRRSERLNNVAMVTAVFLTVFNILAASLMSEVPAFSEVESLPGFPVLTFPNSVDVGGGVEPVIGGAPKFVDFGR